MSRRTEDLTSRARKALAEFDKGMREAGIPYIVTSTLRTLQEQTALYAQGREPLEETNRLRGAFLWGSKKEPCFLFSLLT